LVTGMVIGAFLSPAAEGKQPRRWRRVAVNLLLAALIGALAYATYGAVANVMSATRQWSSPKLQVTADVPRHWVEFPRRGDVTVVGDPEGGLTMLVQPINGGEEGYSESSLEEKATEQWLLDSLGRKGRSVLIAKPERLDLGGNTIYHMVRTLTSPNPRSGSGDSRRSVCDTYYIALDRRICEVRFVCAESEYAAQLPVIRRVVASLRPQQRGDSAGMNTRQRGSTVGEANRTPMGSSELRYGSDSIFT